MLVKKTITLQRRVGCGDIYCIFLEHNNGKFDRLLIRGSMAKSAPCGESWLWCVSKLLTFSLRRAFNEGDESLENGIINQMLYHNCTVRSVATELSCASAIGKCVKQYIEMKHATEKEPEQPGKDQNEIPQQKV